MKTLSKNPNPKLLGYECRFFDSETGKEIGLIEFSAELGGPNMLNYMPPVFRVLMWGKTLGIFDLDENGSPVKVWRHYFLIGLEIDDEGKQYKFLISPAPPPEPINEKGGSGD